MNSATPPFTQRVPVLMYHRIGSAHNDWERKYCVSPETFAMQMEALARTGWKAVSIDDFFAWLDGTAVLPEGAFLLTFDDGFLGVHDHAAPVLRRLDWPATVFLVSALIGERDVWCEKHNPDGHTYPLMDRAQILALREQGFSFHSHTRDHADLPTLDDNALARQLAGARDDLAALLGAPVDYLAYPYGRYDERVLEQAQRAGYRAAFSVQPGFNRPDVDRFRLRRLDVFGTDTPAMLRRKITLGSNDGSLAAVIRYNAARVLARLGIQR
jgi:peptidoglycan/xylan/chitin deacetylase (PgdA/CDA1 family)